MKIEQIYTRCLAQGAYYIMSNGEAAIVDPLRETSAYLQRLEKDGVKLKYIFETHFHADFVSGHVDLSRATGAAIVYGPTAQPAFEAIVAEDEQIFTLGDITIKVLHTPGHTMESTTFLLIDENRKEHCIFSGDTLFLGDVGRPDLAQKATHLTEKELAGLLYESLMKKIMPLNDDVIVYPAHGAGSACGKNMMKETMDTLGHQKQVNYALNQPDKASFIEAVVDGLTPPPGYFGMNVAMNKTGYAQFENVLKKGMRPLNVIELQQAVELEGALLLDTRDNSIFYRGFVPGAVNIGINGDFAPWVGAMIVDVEQPIVLITDDGKEEECITRLSRVGFDNVYGYLQGGFNSWLTSGTSVDTVDRISAAQFAKEADMAKDMIVDVRRIGEYSAEHIENAWNFPLEYINNWISQLPTDTHFYLHCAGGYRSMIAASILQARGFRNFTEIEGGFNAIAGTSVPKTDYVCQSKMLQL